ncbi:hypothetical protein IAR55_001250 [Kwoniella newhampshirensis]|uniref:Uncharacterized protein n=1 Tax=Kwoniella newhampshirensis TaxID=1651941 RepID=A0AAW0Z580_9TREE
MPVPAPRGNSRISPPLPLPLHFALLPSLLPTRNLSPLLYVLINDVPVYLTLDPSHSPHLSLLPLFLVLKPLSPLTILSSLHLKPSEYTLIVDGAAPFVDIWVGRSVARRVCEQLGVGRLFFELDGGSSGAKGKRKGLLGDLVADALSWDEGISVGHNWIPSSAHIPSSTYSLSTLLSTPFTNLSLIEDGRYISTSLDPDSRARLVRESQFGDPSKIRAGEWRDAWDRIIRLSDLAWRQFVLHPSKPSTTSAVERSETLEEPLTFNLSTSPDLLHLLLPMIPTLIYAQSPTPSCPFALSDLDYLINCSPPPPPAVNLTNIIRSLLPSWKIGGVKEDEKMLQYKARMGLSLAELVGGIMVSSWITGRGNVQSKEAGSGSSMVTLKVENLQQDDERDDSEMRERQDDWSKTVEELERCRGGSPEPQAISTLLSRSSQSANRHSSSSRRKSVRSRSWTTEKSLSRSPTTRHTRKMTGSFELDDGSVERRADGTSADEGSRTEVISDIMTENMQSETMRGWYPFVTLGLAIVAGLLMGYIGPLIE